MQFERYKSRNVEWPLFVTEKYSQDPVKPLLSDQAYYPFDKDILNVIHSALGCGQYSKFDQVSWKDWLTHG